jgi:hypothetical protein
MTSLPEQAGLVERFHRVLVDEIRQGAPEYLEKPFSVAEIYQSLVPYRTHRDRLGIQMNGDYEHTLLRLLAGEGDFMLLESEPAKARIRRELEHSNPNTGLYREFAAVGVRLNPSQVAAGQGSGNGPPTLFEADDRSAAATAKGVDEKDTAPAASPEPAPQPTGSGRASRAGLSKSESGSGAQVQGEGRSKANNDAASAVTHCPDCEATLPDRKSLKFCPNCGSNVFVVPCANCGEELERQWKFCVACGVPSSS